MNSPGRPVRFLTVGTSAITDLFLRGAHLDPRFEHAAVFSRREETAADFAGKHGVPLTFTSLEQAARSGAFDAVYIASPNSLHFEQTMLLLEHGKHVLCEKPFASNVRQARQMCTLAREKGLSLMEAMKTTFSPTFARIRTELPRIGTIRRYFASYCQYSSRYDRFKGGQDANVFSPAFSGGSLVDIGVYGVYPMAVLFGMPEDIVSKASVLRTGVDGQGSLICRYRDMDAVIIHSKIADSALPSEIQGEQGRIVIDRINTIDRARIVWRDGLLEDISAPHQQYDMVYELSAFIDMIADKQVESAINSFSNSLTTLGIMDAVRAQNDIVFPSDNF